MPKRNTKQIILEEALTLFAMNGYQSVSVRDIAGAVGIKESSLYKHYKNKQDIFDSILGVMAARYRQTEIALGLSSADIEESAKQYVNMGEEELIKVGVGMFLYFAHDDYAAKFRRMLTIEQYKNPLASQLYVAQFLDGSIAFQTQIFSYFKEQGIMRDVDPEIAAFHFYAPILLLLCRCDNCPAEEEKALETIKRHIVQFGKLYMRQ